MIKMIKLPIKVFLLLTTILIISSSFEWKKKNNDRKIKKQIEEIIMKIDNALIGRDYGILNRYYADDLKLIAPNGFVLDKEQILQPFKDPNKKSALRAINQSGMEMIIKEKFVYVMMKTIHSFEGAQGRVYESLLIFVKIDSEWKLKLLHSSSL